MLSPEKEYSSFEEWMKDVDTIFVSHFGLSSEDLPDAMYRDHYDNGETPYDMVSAYVYDYDDTGLMIEIWES